MASFMIAKAGWLQRESSILHRWKKNWFVLYSDGQLKYFESPDKYEAEETLLIPTEVIYIVIGDQCGDVAPAQGLSKDCLFTIYGHNDRKWQLCGESADDTRAWSIALEEARAIQRPQSAPPHHQAAPPYPHHAPPYPPPSYTAIPGSPYMYRTPQQAHCNYPHQYCYVNQNGERIVYVYDGDRHRHRDSDFASGALAGAAVGSLLFWPMMWWW